jgi:hypothetical protein
MHAQVIPSKCVTIGRIAKIAATTSDTGLDTMMLPLRVLSGCTPTRSGRKILVKLY